MSDVYLTIVIKGMPREVGLTREIFGCPIIALRRDDATKEIDRLENIIEAIEQESDISDIRQIIKRQLR